MSGPNYEQPTGNGASNGEQRTGISDIKRELQTKIDGSLGEIITAFDLRKIMVPQEGQKLPEDLSNYSFVPLVADTVRYPDWDSMNSPGLLVRVPEGVGLNYDSYNRKPYMSSGYGIGYVYNNPDNPEHPNTLVAACGFGVTYEGILFVNTMQGLDTGQKPKRQSFHGHLPFRGFVWTDTMLNGLENVRVATGANGLGVQSAANSIYGGRASTERLYKLYDEPALRQGFRPMADGNLYK